MEKKKVIYISGPIAGVDKYWEAFEAAEDQLIALGLIPISPSRLPPELTEAQRAQIGIATINIADAVLFLPGWENSKCSKLEMNYCINTDTPILTNVEFLTEVLGCLN